MKTLLPIWAFLCAFMLSSCQQKINIKKEKEAILQVLLDEGATFTSYDLEGLSALHIQDETALRMEGGENVYQGWDEIEELYQKYIDANQSYNQKNETDNWKNEKENVITKVLGNTAWSLCDNIWKWDIDGETEGFQNKQLTFLEKVNGEWKISSVAFIPISNVQENMKISLKYHELNPDNMDDILTDDFIGRYEKNRKTWTIENHKKFWSENPDLAVDSIFHQFGQGDWIATRFVRKMEWQGKEIEYEMMHFKRFEDGKIAEIWEYGDSKQAE